MHAEPSLTREEDADSPAGRLERPFRLSALSVESTALGIAALFMVVGTLVALLLFAGRRPALSGSTSVGSWSSVLAAVVGIFTCAFSYLRAVRQLDSAKPSKAHTVLRLLDVAALSFAHAAIAFMGAQAVFYIFQLAFAGLTLDPLAGSLFVGLTCAITGYVVSLSASNVTTYSISNLLAVFLVTGALTAMLTTDNPSWWQLNFSELGSSDSGLAAYAFNATMIISGLMMITLGSYITRDVRRWAQLTGNSRTRVKPLRWSLVVLGIFLALVGFVPVNVSVLAHNTFATGTMLIFLALIIALHFWVPDFPKSFFATSYVLLAAVAVAVLLFWPLEYYNLTGLELAVAALVFGWLVIFIRNLAALVADTASSR